MGNLALALLALATAATPAPITIYVGPQVRDGFVDVDQGTLDSIADIQKQLREDRSVVVVSQETQARLRLYVVRRQVSTGSTVGIASVNQGTGMGISVPLNVRRLETILRVGDYERAFVAEDHDSDSWKKCAQMIAKDLQVWLAANRERVAPK